MSGAVDRLLAEILAISEKLSSAPPEDRARLEAERDHLRDRAAALQATSRSIDGMQAELTHLRRRLKELKRRPIKRTRGKMREAMGAKPKVYEEDWVNRQIDEVDEDDLASITRRIEEIEAELAERGVEPR